MVKFANKTTSMVANGNFRSAIELQTVVEEKINGIPPTDARLKKFAKAQLTGALVAESKADKLRAQIDALKAQYEPGKKE